MAHVKKTTLNIKGMHCASCNILVEDMFKKSKNVCGVDANFSKQQAQVMYTGQLNKDELNRHIKPYGYEISDSVQTAQAPFFNRLMDITVLAGILFILYFFAQSFHLIPRFDTAAGSTLTFLSVFVLGVVASTSTCMATSGALFMATIGKQQDAGAGIVKNLLPGAAFNIGRILSYGFFGFVVGSIGSAVIQNAIFSSIMTAVIAIFMVGIGLSMTGLITSSPLGGNGVLKNIFQRLESRFIKEPKKTAFFLGAITYFLPCGFTQSVQLYALGLAHPLQSALIMMTFAVGTMPVLMALAFTNSFKNFSFYPYFQKVVGIIILVIGISYVLNALAIRGIRISAPRPTAEQAAQETVEVKDGYQIARMDVDGRGYNPNTFTVRQNIPVKWVVNGVSVFGCQGFLVAPQMNIQSAIKSGENVFEFTPKEKGTYSFSCSMGMYRGQFNVI